MRLETRVGSLGWKVPLEKGMAVHSSILVWRIPRTKKPDKLQSLGSVGHDWAAHTHTAGGTVNATALASPAGPPMSTKFNPGSEIPWRKPIPVFLLG